ncbi:hypothetical protein Tco_0777722 [Tanacetum coccineum]
MLGMNQAKHVKLCLCEVCLDSGHVKHKCIVDAEVFRKILDICPRVKSEEFTKVQDDDATLTFLTDLGYKGQLHKYTNMYVDYMHQPWRTLAAIINKCLSRKTASNDRLRKSRIDILWGMFYRENINYPELIWEDFSFQIDHRKERKSKRETMPFPRFTKDACIVSRLNFVRTGEDYQEYRLPIPDTMLNDAIKRSESYQMFLKYSTCQIPPKKSRGKGSQGKKTADTPVADVDVFEESESEPARKRTASRRVVKKKVVIFAADNIIPDPDVALELGKSLSLTEAAKEESARQVHATHARIMTESVSESARRRPLRLPSEILLMYHRKCLLILLKSSRVLEAQVKELVLNQGFQMRKRLHMKKMLFKVTYEENVILEWGSEQESGYSKEYQGDDEEVDWIDSDEVEEKKDDNDDDKSIDLETTNDEETDEEFIHDVEQVNDNEDEEMTKAKVEESRNDDEENTDAAKTDARKTEEVKDDAKKVEPPLTSSSLSVSLGFGDQFLKISFDTSLIVTVKDTTDAEINSLLDIKIQSEVPHIQSPYVLTIPVLVIFEPSILTSIPESASVAPTTTLLPPPSVSTIPPVLLQTTTPILTPPITTDAPTITTVVPEFDALSVVQLRVTKLEKAKLKKIDHSAKALATLKSQVPTVVEQYLGSKIGDDLQKHDDDDDDDDDDPSAGPNQDKKTKRRRTKESESSKKTSTTKETSTGKASTKGSKTGKYASAKKPVEDVVRNDDQPQDTSEPKTYKTLNQDWFKQPPRPPTPDPEWNKRTCTSSIELEYNFQERFNALIDKLDWNNLEGDHYPFDLSKPLPLQGRPGHLTVAVDYFFNNDLEYLKTSDPEKTDTTSITKTKEKEAFRSCEHAPLGLDFGHWFSLMIGSLIVTVGLECEHTDCQAGNPTSLEWCASFALISV